MKLLKRINNIIYWFIILFLIFTAAGTAFSVLKAPGGYRLFVVQSGSMEPKIKTGSVVLVGPQKEYKEGDVITFLANPKASLKDIKSTVTHRIVKADKNSFITKGDANKTADREKVAKKNVLGKVILNIPFFGYVVGFSKTKMGFIALIVIPATLIVYSELINIKKELQRMLGEWKQKSKLKKEGKIKKKKVTKKTKKKK